MLKRERQRTDEARQERSAQRKLYDARIDELIKANREERRQFAAERQQFTAERQQRAAMQQAMLTTIAEMATAIAEMCRQNRTPRNPNPPPPPQP